MNKKKSLKNIADLVVVLAVVLILVTLPYHLVRGDKKVSEIEQRNLAIHPSFALKTFINGEYQKKLESASADQFIGSGTLKQYYKKLTSKISMKVSEFYYAKFTGYRPIGTGNYPYYLFYKNGKHDGYIYEKGLSNDKKEFEKSLPYYKKVIASLDAIAPKNTKNYVYNLEFDRTQDFTLPDDHALYQLLKNNLKNYVVGNFSTKTYKDKEKYSYKTDHHWNEVGSYKGYKEIIELFSLPEKPLEIAGRITTNQGIKFLGARARTLARDDIVDSFTPYYFDFPKAKTYIGKKAASYGHMGEYVKGKGKSYKSFINSYWANHYALYYGEDTGYVHFQTTNPVRSENLLMISFSFGDAIKRLLSVHFNNSYFVDLRHYKSLMGKEFNLKKFVKDNDIDRVLILGDTLGYAAENIEE